MAYYIIFGAIFLPIAYAVTMFVFDLLLRGFAPFIPSRPWVVKEILSELKLKPDKPKMIAFSTGRSGVFHALEKKYPWSELIGVESNFFPYTVAKFQTLIRNTKIKIRKQAFHRVDIKDADLIYSHLYPDKLRGMGEKFKFECRPGTIIVSTGFNIPGLVPFKVVNLEDRKGRFDWMSKNQKLFQRKSKKFKKEPKAYMYEI